MSDYDVIVVGAGPAGTCTAIHAARQGLHVLLLDQKKFPREKTCGDALSSLAIAELNSLGLLPRLLEIPHTPVQKITYHGADTSSVTVPILKIDDTASEAGIICRRILLDALLMEIAAEEEVEVVDWCRITEVLVKGGQAYGVKGERGGGRGVSWTAKVVVGADGSDSLVARQMNMPRYPEYRALAVRGYFRQVLGIRGNIEVHFPEEVLPGYVWFHPTETSQTNVGLTIPMDVVKDTNIKPKQALKRALASPELKERFAFAEQMGEIEAGVLPVGNPIREIHGNGFILVGDAAGLVNPCSSDGTTNAIISARIAGEVLAKTCKGESWDEAALREYPYYLWKEIGPSLEMGGRLLGLRTPKAIGSLIRSASRRPHNAGWISGVLLGSALPSTDLDDFLSYINFFSK
ncbi:MAG: geranylgeranyl reductase family protein [Pseudodesulfovibrio sp.]|uniref:Geranylgeranyl reductase n=2 Tax=Pseudodesulfovibrio TaxID=2035811 RepID=E6VVJ8_PSEA9|nr:MULTISPECIES: geranylgeranyl reductase family protein [Pseudodesulfovibrio]ADU63556.1 geranylgeranyl reductase [Pseudodesulfovibrio aespoeensis Aspo-2]MBV1772160.1 geranylgeranyl reductase family protein [Pseudodesulfovibrio sp.]